MLRALRELVESAGGYVVRVTVAFTPERRVILPPFTSRLPRILLYRDPCMAGFRRLYESRASFRPVRVTVLRDGGGRRLYQHSPSGAPLEAREGEVLEAEVAAYTGGDPDPLGLASEAGGCRGRLPAPFDAVTYESVGAEMVRVEALTTGLDGGPFKLTVHTPLLLDTKLMTPPGLAGSRSVRRTPQAYRLLPTPSYVAAAAVRLLLALAASAGPEVVVGAAYYAGRLADVMVAEVDYKLRPTTAVYGRDQAGRLRRARGPTGYVVYKPLRRWAARLLDKPLALAGLLGLGKSRSIGFGEVTVAPAPPPAKASH